MTVIVYSTRMGEKLCASDQKRLDETAPVVSADGNRLIAAQYDPKESLRAKPRPKSRVPTTGACGDWTSASSNTIELGLVGSIVLLHRERGDTLCVREECPRSRLSEFSKRFCELFRLVLIMRATKQVADLSRKIL